jgi:hypothetical protein
MGNAEPEELTIDEKSINSGCSGREGMGKLLIYWIKFWKGLNE